MMKKLKDVVKEICFIYATQGSRGVRRFLCRKDSVRAKIDIPTLSHEDFATSSYAQWVKYFDKISDEDIKDIKHSISVLRKKIKFSILMPVHDPEVRFLKLAINSILNQVYENWELIIVDDFSKNNQVRKCIDSFSKIDPRIKPIFRKSNGNISVATNDALEKAEGEFLVLMDHDDLLPIHALYVLADRISSTPTEVNLIYTDEDKIDEEGRRFDPYFKSDWNPVLFSQQNFIAHLGCYRTEIAKRIGGFRQGFEGSQDYDFALRFIKEIEEKGIQHVSMVLYHWRKVKGYHSFSSDFQSVSDHSAKKALLEVYGPKGWTIKPSKNNVGFWRWKIPLPSLLPTICIIIPTRDRLDLLVRCISSICELSTYPNYEVIVVDNGSKEGPTLNYLEVIQKKWPVKVFRDDGEFNYSKLNNEAAKITKAEYLILLNNDTEVITPDWMEVLLSKFYFNNEIGIVGCKLVYPDNKIQHAGVVTGIYKAAAHPFKLDTPKDYFGYTSLDRNVSAVTGACLMVKKDLYQRVGGLDEELFKVSFNDVDFCLKVRKLGWQVLWTPDVIVKHYESQSRKDDDTPEKKKLNFRERSSLLKRYGEELFYDKYYNPNLTLDREDFSLTDCPRLQKPWRKHKVDILCPFHRGDVVVGLAVAYNMSVDSSYSVVFHISRDLFDWICPYLFQKYFSIRKVDVGMPEGSQTYGTFLEAKRLVLQEKDLSGKLVLSHPLHSFDRTGLNIVSNLMVGLGINLEKKLKRIPRLTIKNYQLNEVVLLHPTGSWDLKSLPPNIIERIKEVVHKRGLKLVQIGGASDRRIEGLDGYNLVNGDLIYWFDVFRNSCCLIACDSWFNHFATLVDFPSISIYGSTSERQVSSRLYFEEGRNPYLILETCCDQSPCNSFMCPKTNSSICFGFNIDLFKMENFFDELLRKKSFLQESYQE